MPNALGYQTRRAYRGATPAASTPPEYHERTALASTTSRGAGAATGAPLRTAGRPGQTLLGHHVLKEPRTQHHEQKVVGRKQLQRSRERAERRTVERPRDGGQRHQNDGQH